MTSMKALSGVVNPLTDEGFRVYVVGGAVRDMVLGRKPNDFDLCTDATPDDIDTIFRNARMQSVRVVGRSCPVHLVRVGNEDLQLQTFESSGIDWDSAHRDLTINALYQDEHGCVLDPTGLGMHDIRMKTIRAVGDPEERFKEDPLRMMRAVRFACQLDFHMDQNLVRAIVNCLHLFESVAPERISAELSKILLSGRSSRGMKMLAHCGLLAGVSEPLQAMIGCEQGKKHHPEGDAWEHTLICLRTADALGIGDIETMLAVLFHDVGKPLTQEIKGAKVSFYGHDVVGSDIAKRELSRLRFSGQVSESVEWLVRWHMTTWQLAGATSKKLKQFAGHHLFPRLLLLHLCDKMGATRDLTDFQTVLYRAASLRSEDPKRPLLINGVDLIRMGFEEGPRIGDMLKALSELQDDGAITTKRQAIDWAMEELRSDESESA